MSSTTVTERIGRFNPLFIISVAFVIGTLIDVLTLHLFGFAIGGIGAIIAAVVSVMCMFKITRRKPTFSTVIELLHLTKPQLKDWKTKLIILAIFVGLVVTLVYSFLIHNSHSINYSIFLYALSAGIIPPAIEELLNRGFIQSSLERMKYSDVISISISTIIFSLSHYPINPEVIPLALISGILFGIVTIRTKSILIPFIIHGMYNFFITIIIN
jgi:membrane protease YdiL (CAAX protease family)